MEMIQLRESSKQRGGDIPAPLGLGRNPEAIGRGTRKSRTPLLES